MSIALDIEGSAHSSSQSPLHSASLSPNSGLHFLMTESPEHDGTTDQQMGPVIPRVPPEFRGIEENTGCYEPKVVSIGPYHHGKKELEKMQSLKTKMARQLVKDRRVTAEEMYCKVKELVNDARKCYAEESTRQFNDEKFTQMMFLDGYFILQVVSDKLAKQNLRKEEVASVSRDLFLLENQLPFKVLIPLMRIHERKGHNIAGEDKSSSLQKLSSESEDQKLMKIIEHFFEDDRATPPQRESCWEKISNFPSELARKLISRRSKSPGSMGIDSAFDHLLEFFYSTYVISKRHHRRGRRFHRETTSWNRYYSVNELKNVGISFKPSNTSVFTDVKFKQTPLGGALLIPPLIIEDSTKSLLLNLAAYETCAQWYYGRCTSYLCLMRSLIDKPEDVKELRSKGILRTSFETRDAQVLQLFKEMVTNDLAENPTAFVEVKDAIGSYVDSTFRRLILYYKGPISTAVVKYSFLYGFVVSAIQAYVSATQQKSGFCNCSCSDATQLHH
ncbi:hypothetical protein NC653_034318 [Populus alba x Populus x berolinensis]|uniref:Uncharacterized protein n=1 Tax=Populus alba x Populus x berolinensis TaxID=444605 RepID=A0AAD6LNK6_9ROSI|nr:hypothetical protein NC653_034318 [Populus alba x Populus x berolinensis]